jgi:PAS domain S-box-containing protein
MSGPVSAEGLVDTLHAIGRLVSRAESVEVVYAAALEALERLVGANRGAVLLFDASGTMRFVSSRHVSDTYRAAVEGHSPWRPDAPEPEPLVIQDVASDPSLPHGLREAILREGIGALAFIPLQFRGRLLGKLMAYFDEPQPVGPHALRLAGMVADYVAYAISRLGTEAELRRFVDERAAVLDGVDEGIVVLSKEGTFTYANRQARETFARDGASGGVDEHVARYEIRDERGRTVPNEDLPGRTALRTGEPSEKLLQVLHADGRQRWAHVRGRPLPGPDGRTERAVSIWRDVTRERLDQQRRRLLAEASKLLGSSLDLEVTLGRVGDLVVPEIADASCVRLLENGRFTSIAVRHVDPRKAGLVERLHRDLLGDPNLDTPSGRAARTGRSDLVPHIEPERLAEVVPAGPIRDAVAGLRLCATLVVPLRGHDGVIGVWALAQGESGRSFGPEDVEILEELAGRASIAIENARLYREAEQARRHFEVSASSSRVGAWSYDLDSGRITWSPELARLYGIELSQFDGTMASYQKRIHPDDLPGLQARIAAALTEGDEYSTRHRVLLPGGGVRWLEGRGRVIRDAQGRPTGMAGAAYDITDRKLAEDALLLERERLEVTLESIGDGVIATGTDGRVAMINGVAEVLTGWNRAEALGRPLDEVFVAWRGDRRVESAVAQVLRTGDVVVLSNQTVIRSADGARHAVESTASPIRDRDGNTLGVVLVFRDVSQRHKIEDELARASKLESLGLLAGGIAHDFNNLLTVISANVSLADAKIERAHPARQRLADANRAATRAQELTAQLLTFARGGAPIKAPTSIADILRETAGFVLQGSSSRVLFQLEPRLWTAAADAGQISQVVQNLVMNAMQAMPHGGAVRVRADNVVIAPGDPTPLPMGARYVRFSVQDEGVGIPEADLSRVFDPFFTTKSKGTGLGLATAHSIVRRHDGHISIASEVGRGTTVTVLLPTADQPVAAEPVEPVAPARQARILVMDDDAMIRDLARDCLSALDYECVCAESGEQAIAAYERAIAQGRPFDALIMDLTVPGGMGGKEAVARLRARYPEVRAIVSSGYSADPVMSRHADFGFVAVLPKPWRMDDLGRVIANVLAVATA